MLSKILLIQYNTYNNIMEKIKKISEVKNLCQNMD